MTFLVSNPSFQIITSYFPIAVFAVFFASVVGAYLWRQNKLDKILNYGIIAFVIVYILRAGYLTWAQYTVWKNDPFSKFLLPPHESIYYFWQYVWSHYIIDLPWIFGGAIILGIIIIFIGIVSKGRMVDKVDAKLAIFGALIAGWPAMLAYFILSLVVALCSSLVYGIIKRNNTLIPVTVFLILCIPIAFFWGSILARMIGLGNLAL